VLSICAVEARSNPSENNIPSEEEIDRVNDNIEEELNQDKGSSEINEEDNEDVQNEEDEEESDIEDEALIRMGLRKVCIMIGLVPGICWALVEAELESQGVVISSNGPNAVVVHEVQDHLLLPEYPHTDDKGIIHFIHCKQPLWNEEIYEKYKEDKSGLKNELTRRMIKLVSKVSLYRAYAGHKLTDN
jgi:hypothetical protein